MSIYSTDYFLYWAVVLFSYDLICQVLLVFFFTIGVPFRKFLPMSICQRVYRTPSSNNVKAHVLYNIFHSFSFMFLQSEWYQSSFIPLHSECPVSLFYVQCPQNCLLNWLAFLQCKLRIFADNHWNDHLSLSQQSLLYFIGFMSDFCVSLYISLFFNSRII